MYINNIITFLEILTFILLVVGERKYARGIKKGGRYKSSHGQGKILEIRKNIQTRKQKKVRK